MVATVVPNCSVCAERAIGRDGENYVGYLQWSLSGWSRLPSRWNDQSGYPEHDWQLVYFMRQHFDGHIFRNPQCVPA